MYNDRFLRDAPTSDQSLSDRSSAAVDNVITRLREDHGAFPIVHDSWDVRADEYRRLRERFRAGSVGGAGAWITNDTGAVLLIREQGSEAWSEPAGKHEPGETLEATARREVREETGAVCRLADVLSIQRIRIVHRPYPPLDRVIVTFAADYIGGELRPADGEIDDVQWWRTRPPELEYELLERLPIPASEAGN